MINERENPNNQSNFAGFFVELKSGMSYRLWEQCGPHCTPDGIALYTASDVLNHAKSDSATSYNSAVDAATFAQEYCRSLWGASRGNICWRQAHDGFVAGYASGKQAGRDALCEEEKP